MKRPLAAALASVLGACASTETGAGVPEPIRQEVIGTVERFFDAMRSKDLSGLRALLLPSASTVWVDAGTGASGSTSVDEFLSTVESAPYQLNESIWDPVVQADGLLATLWAPYGFHRGSEFSHWGYDAFQLVRGPDGWRIVAIAYTRRTEPMRAPGAPRALDPPSGHG